MQRYVVFQDSKKRVLLTHTELPTEYLFSRVGTSVGPAIPGGGSRAPLRWVVSSHSPEQHPFVVSVHLSKSGCVNCPVTLVRVLETNWRTARIRTRRSACVRSRNDELASPVTGSLRDPVDQSNCIAVRRRRKTPPGLHFHCSLTFAGKCRLPDLNRGQLDLQSSALPV